MQFTISVPLVILILILILIGRRFKMPKVDYDYEQITIMSKGQPENVRCAPNRRSRPGAADASATR